MYKFLDIKVFENLSNDIILKNANLIFIDLINHIKSILKLDPYNKNVKIITKKTDTSNDIKSKDLFSIGVKKYLKNDVLVIEIYENFKKFIKFIFLREIYNLFTPIQLINYQTVQLIINQIIMINLSKSSEIKEWRVLIRENLESHDLLSKGFNRLTDFDRLEKFFKIKTAKDYSNPVKFFFYYLRRNFPIINDNINDIHYIFFIEFANYLSRSIKNDDMLETIRCLIYIFYKTKRYKDFLSYKRHFQEFKKNELTTELSLRKFTSNMNWIQKYSYIAPSYQLNWNVINIYVIAIFLQFNPKLDNNKISKIIENLPFFISPKISFNSFAIDIGGYLILPQIYLKDFVNFIEKLKTNNYILKHYFLFRTSQNHLLNLNYFRKYSQNTGIINPNHRIYDKKYEIEFQIDFGEKLYNQELSILDFLIFDRIRWFSVSGFGFERKSETLNTMKSDLLNEIITQRSHIKNLKTNLENIHGLDELRLEILNILDKNKNLGFFNIKEKLEKYLTSLNLIEEIISNNYNIKSQYQLKNFIKNQSFSQLIEDNIVLNNKDIINDIFSTYIPDFFKSKEIYNIKIEKLQKFYEFINSCYNLKIFNLAEIGKIITNHNIINTLYKTKEDILKQIYGKYKLYNITTQKVDDLLDGFLNSKPPIISPLLIDTIVTRDFIKDFLELILIDSPEIQENLELIKKYFPRVLINRTKDLITKKYFVYVEIYTPKLNNSEKRLFFSIIHNLFKDSIVYCKNFLWSGWIKGFSSKNFYDFEKKEFFYTKDLFEQYFLYVRGVLGDRLEEPNDKQNENSNQYWSKQKHMSQLVKNVNNRISKENIDFNLSQISNLLEFHLYLNGNLLDVKKFQKVKEEYSFTTYVKSIKFIPAFQYFGLGQYFLYLYPSDINEIDFKLLLINSFQKIKFPACIDNSNSFLIKYIMPYGDPNKAYLNWLVKSKKVIREYCGFSIKKMYHLFHFNINITSEGWVYSPDRFKAHMQNILFNEDYYFQIPDFKEFNLSDRKETSHFGPNSPEFESLSRIYNWRSLDIKSYLGTLKYYPTENFTDLIKKDLIFPYLTLKNLDLQDKLYIIIPDLMEELNRTLINIFSFFNYGFIYEIEGEYFIHGFPEEIQFKNGIMIKLYLPDCELSEFIQVFDLLFEYLEIKDYLILNDLVGGSSLLKSVFGGLKFLDSYNPLKNLVWNEKSKVWENHKLFTPKFEPIYPDLIEKE